MIRKGDKKVKDKNNITREIITKLRSKKKYKNIDFEKLYEIFDRAKLESPELDSTYELARLKNHIISEKHARLPSPRRISRINILIPAFAAVILLLVITSLLINNLLHEESNRIYCTLAKGNSILMKEGKTVPFRYGDSLKNNDVIKTGERSSVDLAYNDVVRIRLKENSILSILKVQMSREKKILLAVELSQGKILVDFVKPSRGDETHVMTPTSIAVVRGTSFGIHVDKNHNVRYEVNRGKIKIKNRLIIAEDIDQKIYAKKLIEQLNEAIERNAITLEKNSYCVIESKDYNKFKNAVDDLIKKVITSRAGAESKDILKISTLIVQPGIHRVESHNSIMIPELREFSRKAITEKHHEKKYALNISTQPKDSTISIDGEIVGKGSTTRLVTKGPHHVEVTAKGFHPEKSDVIINDKDVKIAISLKRTSEHDFNIKEWASQVDSSYILYTPRRELLLTINREGRIYAVSKKGLIWRYELNARVNSLPIFDESRLFIATDDERVVALSLENGKPLWSKRIKGSIHFNVRLMKHKKYLYAGTTRGFLYKLDKNGNLHWRMRLSGGINSTPVQSGRFLFVSAHDDNIYGIDVNLKKLIFKVKVGRVLGSTINVKGKRLYISNYDGEVLCYNYELDDIEWRYHTGSRIIVNSTLQGNYLYVSNVNGDITKLDISGKTLWKTSIGNTIQKAPILDRNNIYALSEKAMYVIDKENGDIKWSYVIPDRVTTNIALSKRNMYFGTELKGIMVLKK